MTSTETIRRELEGRLKELTEDATLRVERLVPFGDGHSGFTYLTKISDEVRSREVVVRLSPPGVRIAGTADIGRQGCLMKTLGSHRVPVPGVVVYDSEPTVDGRSFMVVERVDGYDWMEIGAELSDTEVAGAAVAALKNLQGVDVETTASCLGGVEPLTPQAELARWLPLLSRAGDIVGSAATRLWEELDHCAPAPTDAVIVHGDYHYGNLLFGHGAVVAILDWEVAATGESLVDVGSLIVASLRRRYAPEPNSAGSIDVTASDLVAMYGQGLDERIGWFVALNCLKYAAVIAYNLRLHRTGRRVDSVYEHLPGTMVGLVTDGETILREGLAADCLTAGWAPS